MFRNIIILTSLIFTFFFGNHLWQQYDYQKRTTPLYEQLTLVLSDSNLLEHNYQEEDSQNTQSWKTEVLNILTVLVEKVNSTVNQDAEWERKQEWNRYWLNKQNPEPDILWAIELVKWGDFLIQSLKSNTNPFKNMQGQSDHLRVLKIENELVPYRVYLPKGYEVNKKYPVIIGFHSRDGDENLFFHAFNGDDLKKVFDKKQYIFIGTTQGGLLGRCMEPHSKLVVHHLIEKIVSRTDVDVNNIIFLGHSRGGPASVYCAMDRPEIPRTIVLMAPSFNVEKEFSQAKKIDQLKNVSFLMISGSKDPHYRNNTLAMYNLLLAKEFKNLTYQELEGEDHFFTRGINHEKLFLDILTSIEKSNNYRSLQNQITELN